MSDLPREALGDLRFPAPAGWTVEHQVVVRLPRPADDAYGFQPNIVLRKTAVSPERPAVEAVAEDRWRALEHELPGIEPGELIVGELCRHRAVRMTYAWRREPHALAQQLVLCATQRWLYDITFTDVAPRFATSSAEFERWIATLEIDPGTQPAATIAAPTQHSLQALFGRRG